MKTRLFLFSIALPVLLSSCSATKYLPDGEELYTGHKLVLDKQSKELLTGSAYDELNEVIQPDANKKFLGIRLKLFFYNITKEPKSGKKTGWRYFWKYKAGEPPVLLSNVNADHTGLLMENRLQNSGYFFSGASYELIRKDEKVSVTYTAVVAEPYFISEVVYAPVNSRLVKKINETLASSLILPGDQYNLDLLKQERIRIDNQLKVEGYYFFSPDFLVFIADTAGGNRKVKLKLQLKENLPADALQYYRVEDIYMYPDYGLRMDSTIVSSDTLSNNVLYVSRSDYFRPEALTRLVNIRKDSIYNSHEYDFTIKRLMGLGVFQYGNIRYDITDSSDKEVEGRLKASIYLTPFPRANLRTEFQALGKSNTYSGPGMNLIFRNRNIFKGAEQLVLKFSGNYERQFAGGTLGLSSYQAGIEPSLIFPRFITPFRVQNVSSFFIPKTIVAVGFNYQVRQDYYSLNAFNINYGYAWKEVLTKEHLLNPVSIDYVNITKTTTLFDSIIARYPSLQKSFKQQFVLGSDYTYTFSDQMKPDIRNPIFFRGRADFSGNIAYFIQSLTEKNKPDADHPFEILSIPYSMFVRVEGDFRYYYKTGKQSQFAARAFTGIGLPYGNSPALPFFKSYSSGGVNSLRGFRSKSIGPGSYDFKAPGNLEDQIELTGDIKLEFNLEYRFPIYGYFKGALFTDAGNIWMLRDDYFGEAGAFGWNKFAEEIAMSTGAGVRLDASYFVIRLDIAFPIRKPSLVSSQRWVFDEINFGSPGWRKENLILNLGIGYPF